MHISRLGFRGTRRGGGLGESEAGGATAVIIGGIRAHWYSGLANYDPTRTSEQASGGVICMRRRKGAVLRYCLMGTGGMNVMESNDRPTDRDGRKVRRGP